jgi:hypothetical protein
MLFRKQFQSGLMELIAFRLELSQVVCLPPHQQEDWSILFCIDLARALQLLFSKNAEQREC